MSYSGKSPNVNRLRLNPRSADPTNPTEGDVQYADGSAREEGVWVYKNGAWTQIASSSSSGVNYVTDGDGESGQTTGWATYADAAAATPVDGTGGSPNVTFAVTSTASEVLRGSRSLKLVKDAANRQGQGVANSITVERQDYEASKTLFVSFDYKTTANYASNDIRVFVYDVTNAVLYNVQSLTGSGEIAASTTASRFVGSFQTVASSTQYRVIFHVATTNATAYDLILDTVQVSPSAQVPGAIVSDWQTFTPTGSWSTNSTYTGKWRRVGDSMEIQYKVNLAGAPNASDLVFNMPSGFIIDTTKLANAAANEGSFGSIIIEDSATRQYQGGVQYASTTTLTVSYDGAANNGFVNATNPFTFASGDSVGALVTVPVVGWAASASLSTTETMLTSAKARYVGATQSIPGATATILNAATQTYDSQSSVTTGASWKFTAPKSAKYKVHCFGQYVSRSYTVGQIILVQLFKNGVQVSQGSVNPTQTTTSVVMGFDFSDTIQLAAGDYIDLRGYNEGSGSTNTDGFIITVEELPDFSIFSVYGQTEYSESKAQPNNAWPFSASAYGDLTSLLLQPGEYDLTGILEVTNSGAVTAGFVLLGISTTSGDSGAGITQGDNRAMLQNPGTSGAYMSLTVPNYRVVVTAPTTYYLKGYCAAAPTNFGQEGYRLSARRVK